MKTKMYVLAALLMASMTNVMAEETCTKIWYDGEDWHNQAITYEKNNTLFISKDKFSSAVVGNAIKMETTLKYICTVGIKFFREVIIGIQVMLKIIMFFFI